MNFGWIRMVSEKVECNGKRNRWGRDTSELSWRQHEIPFYLHEGRHITLDLALALKHSFVSLFTTYQKMVPQLPSDPREIDKIPEVTGFLLIFVLIQAQANISVKCLSFFRQKVFYLIHCDSGWDFLIDKKLITEQKLHSCQRLVVMYCIGRR